MPILRPAAFQRLALFDMGLEIADMAAASAGGARTAGKPCVRRASAWFAAAAIAGGIDVGLVDGADIGPGAEEAAEMAFLVAPGGDLDGALDGRDRD